MSDPFTERLALIRTRFASNLSRTIESVDSALPQLVGEGETVNAALATAHRSVHGLCGMGPTVGFVNTGKAARVVERILLQPLRAKRGLTQHEVTFVRKGLAELRNVAQAEIQTNGSMGQQ